MRWFVVCRGMRRGVDCQSPRETWITQQSLGEPQHIDRQKRLSLQAFLIAAHQRRDMDQGAIVPVRYYISGLDDSVGCLLEMLRRHWSIDTEMD